MRVGSFSLNLTFLNRTKLTKLNRTFSLPNILNIFDSRFKVRAKCMSL